MSFDQWFSQNVIILDVDIKKRAGYKDALHQAFKAGQRTRPDVGDNVSTPIEELRKRDVLNDKLHRQKLQLESNQRTLLDNDEKIQRLEKELKETKAKLEIALKNDRFTLGFFP